MTVKIGVPGETAADETRVALIPPVAKRLVDSGHDVVVTAGAGTGADWNDGQYADVGCEIIESRETVFDRSDIILQIRALGALADGRIEPYRDGQTLIGLLGPYNIGDETLDILAERRVSAFALELLPRIGRAQSMDVLPSMASIGGYKAAVMAADTLPSLFPIQMTAAGTVKPADVFVVGGVGDVPLVARIQVQARGDALRLGESAWNDQGVSGVRCLDGETVVGP